MGRLIDSDSLTGCAIIRPITFEDIEHINACEDRIRHNDIPTAYDVDKVVEEIKSLSGYEIYKKTFELIIEIVRKGGVNE